MSAFMVEPKPGDKFWIMGMDWLPLAEVTIIRTVVLAGVSGFAIHEYYGEYRISHIETGALVSTGIDDGEVFVRARAYVKGRGGKEGISTLIRRLQAGIAERKGHKNV